MPVPAPIITTGVVVLRGRRKVEGRAATHSLSPTDTCVHSIVEHAPRKQRDGASPRLVMRAWAFAMLWPLAARPSTTSSRLINFSCTMLTQRPMVFRSAREEDAIVYGRLFWRGHSCKKVPKSKSAVGRSSSNISRRLRRTPSPVIHLYASVSCRSFSSAAWSAGSLANAASFFMAARDGHTQRSQYRASASRTVHGVGKGFFTALSTPGARVKLTLLSSSASTPSRCANQFTVSSGLQGSTSKLSAVFQSSDGIFETSTSMCFVVSPASTSTTCRSCSTLLTGACAAPKYHLPSTSAPPTCTSGSTGSSLV
mmetsp:Transcript_90660/g.234075  ORF Transcript_90660/g.234075 Transcript_90660/m.234075 type:complete len:312 (+) Transcript_90660:473-1408(+)